MENSSIFCQWGRFTFVQSSTLCPGIQPLRHDDPKQRRVYELKPEVLAAHQAFFVLSLDYDYRGSFGEVNLWSPCSWRARYGRVLGWHFAADPTVATSQYR